MHSDDENVLNEEGEDGEDYEPDMEGKLKEKEEIIFL